MDNPVKEIVKDIVVKYQNEYSEIDYSYILDAINLLLSNVRIDLNSTTLSGNKNFNLSKVLEKTTGRKDQGRYYTPKDVTEYIITNSLFQFVEKENKIYSVSDCVNLLLVSNDFDKLIYSKTFDPTCGSGEFLVSMLETKIQLYKSKYGELPASVLIDIVNSIHGNDIEINAVEITKIRLLLAVIGNVESCNLVKVSQIINDNFSTNDFVNINFSDYPKFDVIVGNPPYVEDSKSNILPNNRYGNIYANVLENSSNLLSQNGVMGFVIPISYVATTRMKSIRSVLNHNCPRQFLLNYADRPDCLFQLVHQKLTILLCSNSAKDLEQYTSGYKYWYKSERSQLLTTIDLIKNPNNSLLYIPKLSNCIENSTFKKLLVGSFDKSLSNLIQKEKTPNVYLGMRGYFWMKAFSEGKKSNEYKGFCFEEQYRFYILSILNSSLFFFFWVTISDCWHITDKELSSFRVVLENVDFEEFKKLFLDLEKRLEETKEFIGTKQTDYAYKHKLCKQEVDKIDVALAKVYHLTEEELNYIINYNLKYRMSNK